MEEHDHNGEMFILEACDSVSVAHPDLPGISRVIVRSGSGNCEVFEEATLCETFEEALALACEGLLNDVRTLEAERERLVREREEEERQREEEKEEIEYILSTLPDPELPGY